MKIAINKCFGGFGLSPLAVKRYAELCGFELYPFDNARDENGNLLSNKYAPVDWDSAVSEEHFLIHYSKTPLKNGKNDDKQYFSERDIERTDKNLIKVIEELGDKSFGSHAELKIIEIPDDVKYEISDYDGMESVHEVHRHW